MNKIKIKCNDVNSLDSLKLSILGKLNIRDFKKDCLAEFETRLKRYLDRHPRQTIILEIYIEKIKLNIKQRVSIEISTVIKYPEGFQFGQPHMLWGFEPDPRTPEEIEKEKSEIEAAYNARLSEFQNGLAEILQLANGRVITHS